MKKILSTLATWLLLLLPLIALSQPVTLTYPNGGETLTAGSTINITFSFTPGGPANDVFVLELFAGGELYQTLTPSSITASPFAWTIPGTIASRNDYRIRVRRATASAESDFSDGTFSITGGRSISITQPNGGQAIPKPGAYMITWTSVNLPATQNVRIELLRGNVVQSVLFNATPNDGSELWNVDAGLPDDHTYRIRISSVADPFVNAVSADDFMIGRVLRILSPTATSKWQRGTTQQIQWQTSLSGNFRIDLLKAGVLVSTISLGTSVNPFSWTVPNTLADGNDYQIRLTNNSDPTATVTSPNFIIGNYLILNTPSTGTNVLKGANYNITWETNLTGNLAIVLLHGTDSTIVSASTPAAAGSFTWTVPITLPDGSYRIRLRSLATTPIYVATSGNFNISGPFGRVTSPNGGEVFNRTRTYPITWESNLGGNVTIDLMRAGTLILNLASNIPNSGTFNWLIPPTVTLANNYRIRITFHANGSIDESDANFEIIGDPSITVQVPNGGETFFRTRNHNITWTDNIPENVKIDLFRGTNFLQTIAASVPSTGIFTWTVPGTLPLANNYRVRISSTADSTLRDFSDNPFTIANNDTIRVVAPNGGEVIVRGTSFTIQWQTNITSGNVIIELLQNNTLVGVINPAVPATQGSFVWIASTTLGLGSEGYRIRIRTDDNRASDVSDNDFRLLAQQFALVTPSSGQELFLGYTYDITWISNLPGNVRIDLVRGSVIVRNIANNVSGNIFRWTLPTDIIPGSDYRIRITNLTDETRFDENTGFITITRPQIRVISPNGGESWFSNNFRYTITWEDNLAGNPVRIDLLKGGAVLQNITPSATGGSFAWTLPDNLQTGADYRVRISAAGAPAFFDDSNADFRITRPQITVISPANGDIWFRTLSYNIVWQSNLGNLLHRIDLVTADGTLVREIASTVENSGTFNRLITPDFPLGTNYRIRVSVATNSAVFGLSGIFSIAIDNIPPVITNTNFPTVLDFSQTIESIAPTITATDNVGIQRVVCSFKGITQPESAFRQRDAVLTDNVYRAFIASADFDELGVEYFFEVFDRAGNTTRSQRGYTYVRYSSARGISIPDIRFGFTQQDYQIISIPLNLDNKEALAVFENELGSYDNKRWRLFHYENGQNLEYPEGFRNILLGKGYWLIVREPWSTTSNTIDTGPGDGARANQQNPFVMNLQQGWNQIGSPYNFNISWNDVRTANNNPSGLGRLRTFSNGSFRDEDVLRRFRGGFVFADRAMSIQIPVLKNRNINSGRTEEPEPVALRNPINSPNWEVPLQVQNGELINQLAGFGMRTDASPNKDDYDEMTLPRFGDYLEVNFLHPEYFYPKFSKDVVPTASQYIWEFTIETNRIGGKVSIQWDNSYFGQGTQLFLHDRDADRYVEMNKLNRYVFQSEGPVRRFRIIYGDWNFVQKQMQVERFSLQVYPNPAHDQVNFDFALPEGLEGATIRLSIINSIGQEVYSESIQCNPGFHTRTWEQNGVQALPAGVYLCRMQVSHALLERPLVATRRIVIE